MNEGSLKKAANASKINEANYVNTADAVIRYLKEESAKPKGTAVVSTSKIRNLLAMSADIYNEVLCLDTDELSDECKSRIEYLKVRMIYEAGRDVAVKNLIDVSGMRGLLNKVKNKNKEFILFNRYMESLVAFRKYYCGNDD